MAVGTTNIGFEEKLWQAADKLRSNMDAAEYKHVVLGLIFLKYVSDSFEEKYRVLLEERLGWCGIRRAVGRVCPWCFIRAVLSAVQNLIILPL